MSGAINMAITLQETLRGAFYAPFYVALARGAYAQEGVDVRFRSAAAPGRAALDVLDGATDVSWGGPMRVAHAYQTVPGCDLVSFAEIVGRDPFILVGRVPRPRFAVRELVGLRVGSVSEVPTPWLCLQEDLRRAGVDPTQMSRVADRSMADNAEALRRGELDVVQVFEPVAARLLADGAGHVWYAAANRGLTSYTTFYTRRRLLQARPDELRAMVRAIHRTLKWVAQADGPAIAAAVAPFFPELSAEILAASYTRYKALGIWNHDPLMKREGYDRLLAGLVSGGFVSPGTPFDVAVDNSLAEASVAADPPVLR
jgi:NitT/TauT family transport system substrate-binding protein